MTIPKFKVGDDLPILRGTLTGIPADVDLATATAIRFHMKNAAGEVVLDKPASIDNAATRRVSYAWEAGDTDLPGLFLETLLALFFPARIAGNSRHIGLPCELLRPHLVSDLLHRLRRRPDPDYPRLLDRPRELRVLR